MKTRNVSSIFPAQPFLEGAGVHLRRVFSRPEAELTDPFLLLDDFRSDEPGKYLAGFPWHPHRGIETITYMLEGHVEHGDSMGNKGVIRKGDVQWMTAGSGIIHQEMPKGDSENRMYGFQLWANLPASHKMMSPRYREINAAEIPEVKVEKGVRIKVISGSVAGIRGPVEEIVTEPEYLDVSVPPGTAYMHPVKAGHTAIAYVIEGAGNFGEDSRVAANRTGLLFSDGDQIRVEAQGEGVRFLLFSGKPINEPIVWGGPIVMNTQAELRLAFEEYDNGTFIK
ncbi:MAG: pirin family protein [Spirochaetaceae bacterium]|nr:MAG: pirin family protein [Spirochaetaceae bacterium]